jgi:hypothetical protein
MTQQLKREKYEYPSYNLGVRPASTLGPKRDQLVLTPPPSKIKRVPTPTLKNGNNVFSRIFLFVAKVVIVW